MLHYNLPRGSKQMVKFRKYRRVLIYFTLLITVIRFMKHMKLVRTFCVKINATIIFQDLMMSHLASCSQFGNTLTICQCVRSALILRILCLFHMICRQKRTVRMRCLCYKTRSQVLGFLSNFINQQFLAETFWIAFRQKIYLTNTKIVNNVKLYFSKQLYYNKTYRILQF